MPSSYRTRLWRTLAFCMVLGAAGLAAYYYFVQTPMQAAHALVEQELTALEQQVDEARARAPQIDALPAERLRDACERYQAALRLLPQAHDADASVFAIEELARSARLENYNVTPSTQENTPVSDVTQDRIALTLDGEQLAIDRLLNNIQSYGKAGHFSSLSLQHSDDEENEGRRGSRTLPTFEGHATVDAYFVSDAAAIAANRCQELGLE